MLLLSVLIVNRILIGMEPDGAGQKLGVVCALGSGWGREGEMVLAQNDLAFIVSMLSR